MLAAQEPMFGFIFHLIFFFVFVKLHAIYSESFVRLFSQFNAHEFKRDANHEFIHTLFMDSRWKQTDMMIPSM